MLHHCILIGWFLLLFTFASCQSTSTTTDVTIEGKIDKILEGMTVEEKAGQTCQITLDAVLKRDADNNVIEPIEFDPDKLKEALVEYGVGSILNVVTHTLTMEQWEYIEDNVYTPFDKGETKAPIIYGIDAIHGVNYTVGGTLFPQEIGLAATWNPELARQFGEVVAYETRASGIHWNFSPVLDMGRAPLWARHFETLGEDPLLTTVLGDAIVEGYQGEGTIDPYHTAACLKHFVGYSGTVSGRDRTTAWIPEKYMQELYLPPFKSAVAKGALTLMINSGDVNGIPGHINYNLLTKTLKDEWGFKGFTVSDWEDFIMLHTVHSVGSSLYEAAVKGFNAGVDMSMVPYNPQYKDYIKYIIKGVKEGKITEERLDDAVRRILRVKMKVGLFEKNRNQAKKYPKFGEDTYKKLALESALESITLLKNDNNILPLDKAKKVLVAGPTSNNLIFLNGAWTHTWQGGDTSYNTKGVPNIKEAFIQQLGKENCLFAQGAEVYMKDNFETSRLVNPDDFKAKAKQSDVIVLCLGEFPGTEKPGDILSLNLDPAQLELAEMAYATGKPVVLVLAEGRPRVIRTIVDGAAAIVQTYLPGDYGAKALTKLVYGEENFSGKLPYTYPRHDGLIEFYDHPRSTARAKTNGFDSYNPQWDFGFGMSYSTLEYSDLTLSTKELKEGESVKIQVKVTNKSDRAVKETVQLYIADEYASIVPANKRLKAFKKIPLAANESKVVDFLIHTDNLKFVNANNEWIVEAGSFKVMIEDLETKFELK
ncbi:MAG: glycoside hydrolase family 3 N-terminal domain-containing protein [Aureispira sp.]